MNLYNHNNKKVVAINLETEEEKVFDSLTKAAKELHVYVSNISRVCNNKAKYTKSKLNGQKYYFSHSD